jgi:23S rRNA pseudouridine2605 synthase
MNLVQAVVHLLNIPRRQASSLIDSGKVLLNDKVVTQYTFPVDLSIDRVTALGREIGGQVQFEYFIYHKPRGVITSLDGGSNSLLKVLQKNNLEHVKPVGRLDKDSEGLLLLTNDGNFINKMLHPKFHVKKIYEVRVTGCRNNEQIESLKKYFTILKLEILSEPGRLLLELELEEGKNRQIRRTCAQIGLHVESILRTAIGAVKLGELKLGFFKSLSKETISKLMDCQW